MPIVSVYQCPRCSKKWNMDKKSNYIKHLRHHVSRDRFKSIWEEIEKENAIFLARIKLLAGYADFVKIVQSASPLIFYNDFFFNTNERSDINLVRNLEKYIDKKVSDIFPDTAEWSFMKHTGFSPSDVKTNFNINFGKGELFLANDFNSRRFDSGFTLGINIDKDGVSCLTANISEISYYSNDATKRLYKSLSSMAKLKQ